MGAPARTTACGAAPNLSGWRLKHTPEVRDRRHRQRLDSLLLQLPEPIPLACCRAPGIGARRSGGVHRADSYLGALEVEVSEEDCRRLDEVAPPRSVSVAFYDTTRGVDAGPRTHRF